MDTESTVINENVEEGISYVTCLFNAVKEAKAPEEKVKAIKICLENGVDVNIADKDDKNTPLHVAALKGELHVVRFLLEKEANIFIKNKNNHNIFHIAQLPNTPNATELYSLLKTHQNNRKSAKQTKTGTSSLLHRPDKKTETPLIDVQNEINNTNFCFKKREGTSGISGHLYETKLLSLILFRALHDDNIKEFSLGTNIDGLGALDDIIFSYQTKDNKSKIMFIQAKHRKSDKDLLKVEDLFKRENVFDLSKYFESYLIIKHKFLKNDNHVKELGGPSTVANHDLIIFTPVKECFTKKKLLEKDDKENLLITSKDGKMFKFEYEENDLNLLISMLTKRRVIKLAKSLANYINKDNYKNMMLCQLIKTYHVYLARNVIAVESQTSKNEPLLRSLENDELQYCIGKFRPSFLTSTDENLVLLRSILCEEMDLKKGTVDQHDGAEINFKLLSFKLPAYFGNLSFCFRGTEKKRRRRLNYLCSVFEKLLQNNHVNDSTCIRIILNEDSIGPDKIIQHSDLEYYRLAGLVGNLLIYDNETHMLKFNLVEQDLPTDCRNILQQLKVKGDLSKFRFDINILGFPQWNIVNKKHEFIAIRDFLSKLIFYTNQAKEDEVEILIKKEISYLLNVHENQSDSLSPTKYHAIFLKFHDLVLKWWKTPLEASNLNKSCNFFQQVQREIFDSSLLNVINCVYTLKIKNFLIEFSNEAISALKLDWFSNSDKTNIILTDNVSFSSMKLIQYYDKTEQVLFLDLCFVISENILDTIISELGLTNISVLVLILSDSIDIKDSKKIIKRIIQLVKGKVIILMPNRLKELFLNDFPDNAFNRDIKNNFNSFSSECRNTILDHRQILFQGELITVKTVLNNTSLDLLSSHLLYQIICYEKIVIGEALSNSTYSQTEDRYVNRSLCRFITLCPERFAGQNNTVPNTENELSWDLENDILLISQSITQFEQTCNKNEERNIHWFTSNSGVDAIIWKQSHGHMQTLMKYVERGAHDAQTLKIMTLQDIKEKHVIISAEPGMGKSILLTHLAIITKRLNPNLWILNIKLLDHVNQFDKWKHCNTKKEINLLEVIMFLYSVIDVEHLKRNDILIDEITKSLTIKDTKEIYINTSLVQEDLWLMNLFIHFYNNNNVAILLDGFDEICPDYADQVIQILSCLKSSKVAHLWVTSRPYNVLEQLELSLDTFSYTLTPFNEVEQQLYLKNVWSQKLRLDNALDEISSICVEDFLFTLIELMHDFESFMGIPLHLYMIAETYEHLFRHCIDCKQKGIDYHVFDIEYSLNMTTLYEKFTDTKFFHIRFSEKKPPITKDPDMRKIIENERKIFMENHKKLAASLLFDANILSKQDWKDVILFKENIKSSEEKTGIVERLIDNEAKFVHMTFAEYFAVEYLFDKLRSEDCAFSLCQYFINSVLINLKKGIRVFVNSKLKTSETFNKELDFSPKIKKIFFKLLMAQSNEQSHSAITLASRERSEHIAKFLIQCVNFSVNKTNLVTALRLITNYDCAFCHAVGVKLPLIIDQLIKLVTDIDPTKLRLLYFCSDTEKMPPLSPLMTMLICRKRCDAMLEPLLQYDPDLLVDLFVLHPLNKERTRIGISEFSAAHYLGKNGSLIEHFWEYLLKLNIEQRLKIFSLKDFDGRSPLHYAVLRKDYRFLEAVCTLLGKEAFKKIITTADVDGITPISNFCFKFNSNVNYDSFKTLVQEVNEEVNVDVADFVIKILGMLGRVNDE